MGYEMICALTECEKQVSNRQSVIAIDCGEDVGKLYVVLCHEHMFLVAAGKVNQSHFVIGDFTDTLL